MRLRGLLSEAQSAWERGVKLNHNKGRSMSAQGANDSRLAAAKNALIKLEKAAAASASNRAAQGACASHRGWPTKRRTHSRLRSIGSRSLPSGAHKVRLRRRSRAH